MNERQPEATEIDDIIEDQIDRMMNTRGMSRAEAELLMLPRVRDNAPFTREESRRLHPSAITKRPRQYSAGRPPVGEDSQDVYGEILNDEQVATNTRGIALARQVFSVSDTELTTRERAIERARREKKERGFNA